VSVAAPLPLRVHTLHPGDVACVGSGERLETLLGSCVAIILTDPRRTVGAMCHVVHAGAAARGATESTAFGRTALVALGGLLRARGIEPRLCQSWVFGGGNMFPALVGPKVSQGNVGQANVNWALQALHEAGIQVLGGDLGGAVYRRVRWTVGPGEPEVDVMSSAPEGPL
jgi:chemotaxis protein CheD